MAVAQPGAPGCADEKVDVAAGFDSTWSDSISEACQHLAGLQDRDPGATLSLDPEPSGSGVRVRLELGDGRRATRIARVPEELSRVMEALVTLPPPMSEPPAKSSAPAEAVASGVPAVPKKPASLDAASADREDSIPLSYDVALLATMRLLGPAATLGLGIVASGDLDIDRGWVVGLRARADLANLNLEHDADLSSVTLGGGAELARRISIQDSVAVDLGLGADGLADVPVEGRKKNDDARGDVRVRTFAKLWVTGQGLSFAGLLGFELSPIRVGEGASLPAFGGELGAGIGWGGL